MFGGEFGEGAAELVDPFGRVGSADADGHGGVVAGLVLLGGGAGCGVDPAAQAGRLLRVGFLVETVDGQIAQERAGGCQGAGGQSGGKGRLLLPFQCSLMPGSAI